MLRAASAVGCLCPLSGDRPQAAMEMHALAVDNAAAKQHLFPSKLNKSAGRPSLTQPPLTGRLTRSQALPHPHSPPFPRPTASLGRRLRPRGARSLTRGGASGTFRQARPCSAPIHTRTRVHTPARTCLETLPSPGWVEAVFHSALNTYHSCGSEGLFPLIRGLFAFVIDENVRGFPIMSDSHVSDVSTVAQARRVPYSVRAASKRALGCIPQKRT